MKQPTTVMPNVPFGPFLQRASAAILLAAALFGHVITGHAQTYSLSNSWALSGATQNLDTSADNRGMCYASSSNGTAVNFVIVNNKGTHAIYVYDGGSGSLVTSVNSNNLSGGNFSLNKIGVTPAGQLIGANLTTAIAAGTFKIYYWTDWTMGANVSYTSTAGDALMTDLPGKRIGDSFAMTGSGTNTLLLFSIGGVNEYALFSTTDGVTFTPTVLTVTSGLPATGSGVQIGYAFYTNNTFMIAPNGGAGNLYLVQFPTNFASFGTNLVTATVIATNSSLPTGNSGNWLDLHYNASAGLLAMHPNASAPISLYGLPSTNFSSLSLLASTNLSFTTSQTINGNETGDNALAATNYIYTLDTSAGLQATAVSFMAAPVPPTISTPPVGGTVYTNLGSYTFTVTASGSPPLYYFWQYNTVSNQATATTIAVTTNTGSYTVSPLPTNASGWYDVVVSNVAGTSNSAPVQLTVNVPLASPYVTTLWKLAADNSQPYLDTSYNTRGLAFDPHTMSVLLAEHSQAQIYALNATNGQLKFLITTPQTGLPSGSIFPLGQVGVADDGVVYCCNVSSYQPGQQNGSDDFSITRFDSVVSATNGDGSINSSNTFEAAWTGDPGNDLTSAAQSAGATYSGGDRWGDSFAVRGAGTNTQILLGTYEDLDNNSFGTGPGTNIAILTTLDGTNFTPTTLVITDTNNGGTPPSGFAYLGVAWGVSNTFWTKSPGFDLRQIQYNLAAGTGTVIQIFSTTAGSGSLQTLDGIGLDNSNNILAGVQTSDSPNDLELFQIPTTGFPPQAYYQSFFTAYNANINGNAATTLKYPYIFSLDANNGIIGLQYTVPPPPITPYSITNTYTGGILVLTWPSVSGHTYNVISSPVVTTARATWTTNASYPGTGGTLAYTNSSITNARYFTIQGQ